MRLIPNFLEDTSAIMKICSYIEKNHVVQLLGNNHGLFSNIVNVALLK